MPGEDLRPVEKFRHIPAFRGRNLGFQILETLSSRDCFNEVTAKLESALSKHVWKSPSSTDLQTPPKLFIAAPETPAAIFQNRHVQLAGESCPGFSCSWNGRLLSTKGPDACDQHDQRDQHDEHDHDQRGRGERGQGHPPVDAGVVPAPQHHQQLCHGIVQGGHMFGHEHRLLGGFPVLFGSLLTRHPTLPSSREQLGR
eukprot:s336_g24.t1